MMPKIRVGDLVATQFSFQGVRIYTMGIVIKNGMNKLCLVAFGTMTFMWWHHDNLLAM